MPGADLKTRLHYRHFTEIRVQLKVLLRLKATIRTSSAATDPQCCNLIDTLMILTFLICAFIVLKVYQNRYARPVVDKTAAPEREKDHPKL